ncbi:hypothetical protein QBC35DRAFT_458436 [Podospora australis]|uniref:DUF1772-domain-containing protein n=1 Tax=Podospora australis TaxID=1536484 RepID=A0AAN6X5Q4_9PEZI|nr:hypothetical protein QBC35DRAFT_458436 [Podospora australis]
MAPSDMSITSPLEATTLLLSSLTTGLSLSFSVFLTPRLLEAPTPVMLTLWKNAYAQGKASLPTLTVATAAGYLYLALSKFRVSNDLFRAKLYAAAALLSLGIVPYTYAVMLPTNNALHKKEAEINAKVAGKTGGKGPMVVTEAEERGAKALVDWWGVLNLGRSVLLGVGAGVGVYASLW